MKIFNSKKNGFRKSKHRTLRGVWWLAAALFVWTIVFNSVSIIAHSSNEAKIEITANFKDKELLPAARLELKLNRALTPDEGRLAVMLGDTDITALFVIDAQVLSYTPRVELLPVGESALTVYLVSPGGDWKTLAEFKLKVKESAAAEKTTNSIESGSESESKTEKTNKRWKTEFTPNLSLNVKGQDQTLTFPRENEPQRNPFTDVDGQGNVFFKVTNRSGWFVGSKFDFVGVSFQQNALRFSELQKRAPMIDLSSYLVEFGRGKFKVSVGHVSFGSNRHLINSFSSRGVTVTVPIGKQNEISFAAMNGTSVVGFGNFFGVTRRDHSVVSTTFAREFIKERPNGLRFEFSVMRGSLLPLSNFNQGEVNDAEKSVGFGFKVIGNAFKERLRYEAGYTRSRFTNPVDPLLEQGLNVVQTRPVMRGARYGEISYDILHDLKLWREKTLKVTGTYRHEEIEPLFRSVVVSTQADKRQNQFEVSANFGEINFAYGNLRDRDNLRDIPSILKTLNRRRNFIFGIPLNSFFTTKKSIKWLPQVSYTDEHVHQFGAFLPTNGDFRDASQVPDQHSYARSFNAQWTLSQKYTISARYSRAFQDNRQPGRELADFKSQSSGVSFGINPSAALNLSFDISRESQKNFEQPRIDNTLRFGSNVAWQTPFLKDSTFSLNFSTTFAGDAGNLNDSRNADFDAQWAYKFKFGKEKFKKLEAQFFIRYANRYGDAIDRVFFINSFNKTQSFNAGLTFNFF